VTVFHRFSVEKDSPSLAANRLEFYKARHLIDNFFAKLKQYRAIATRYAQ
jgi:transposase